jgi:hypothetical protein
MHGGWRRHCNNIDISACACTVCMKATSVIRGLNVSLSDIACCMGHVNCSRCTYMSFVLSESAADNVHCKHARSL